MKLPFSKYARPIGIVLSSAAILVAVSACRSVRRDEPLVGPVPLDDPKLAQGRLVFANRCHACHPGGAGGLGPALNNKPLPQFLMKIQVRRGLGAMPEFDQHAIPPEDLDALVKYVATLRKHDNHLASAKD